MRNFILSITMLVSMTACQNGENLTSNTPEEVQKQTFQSKTSARGSEELPKLSPEEEKAMIQEAMEHVNESILKGGAEITGRRSTILCHTDYNVDWGHACVYNNGYLVSVSWDPGTYSSGEYTNWYPDGPRHYSGHVVPRCNC